MKPILFNTEMVRAILAGQKTVTRRVMKPQPVHENRFWKVYGAGWSDSIHSVTPFYGHSLYTHAPYKPEDILWVRETWCRVGEDVDCINFENSETMYDGQYLYRADGYDLTDIGRWHPSIHMPQEAARLFLRVTDVRVERLQDIQERGKWSARDEGFVNDIDLPAGTGKSATRHFMDFWDSTIKPKDRPLYGREANPWVWVIMFERIEKP